MTPRRVRTGLDRLAEDRFKRLRGRRVGAICNPTSVNSDMEHLADLFNAADRVELACLFGPEHGIRGDAQDMVGVASSVDVATGVPVHSLYGETAESLRPRPEWLDGLDVLVFDVQDVGSRYYTFVATMLYAMEACAGRGITFVVLDRPNPIGGSKVAGPTVEPGYESFVGAHPMPIRHGMTVGELARMFAAEKRLDLELEVVTCEGWARWMHWPATGIPWIPPSPNMPSYETALVYPGACLIEGTNLSEGWGTTRPFEQFGAPWLEGSAFVWGDPTEVLIRVCSFRPMFQKYAGQTCHGPFVHVVSPEDFDPLMCYGMLIARARFEDPERFAWRTEPYEFVEEPMAIDLLWGSAEFRTAIDQNSLPWLQSPLTDDGPKFERRRQPFLLYA